jgi:sporulation protein YhbH
MGVFTPRHIERDNSRFRKIVRGAVKTGIRKYLSHGELIGRTGKDLVSIPLPQLQIPRFRFGDAQKGVGQGQGEIGDPVAIEPEGDGQAGGDPAEHILEVELTIEELTAIIAEELELPRIEPRGKRNVVSTKDRYTGIAIRGPEALRHVRRTFRQALKRQMASGTYQPADPYVWPYKEDRRYRSWKPTVEPESSAVIIYMMDVSGSMGDEQKELVRLVSFWIDMWLTAHYKGLERRFIIHDAAAREVDEHAFFHTRESGGTRISSAYQVALGLIATRFNPNDYNIYTFHFSDGDNFFDDNERAVESLRQLIQLANLSCYGQVQGGYGAGNFIDLLTQRMKAEEKLITARIKDKGAIYDALKAFLGSGR